MPEKAKYDVYLSYSSKDKQWVSEFAAALKNAGVNMWFDIQDIALGEKWQEQVQRALRESSILIMILSQRSMQNPNTFFELGAAVAGK